MSSTGKVLKKEENVTLFLVLSLTIYQRFEMQNLKLPCSEANFGNRMIVALGCGTLLLSAQPSDGRTGRGRGEDWDAFRPICRAANPRSRSHVSLVCGTLSLHWRLHAETPACT